MSNSLQPIDQMVPGANLPAYVQAVSAIPVLSVERERELAEVFNVSRSSVRACCWPVWAPGSPWPR